MGSIHDGRSEAKESNWSPEFITIPYQVFRDPSISHAAKLVYGRLKLYAGKDGQCNPHQETLAAEVCLCDRQLRTVLEELRLAGWIDWRRGRTCCYFSIYDQPKTGRKLPVSTLQSGRKLPVSKGSDRKKTATLDRKKTAAQDRKKTADRKEVVENHHQKRSKTSAFLQGSVVAETEPPAKGEPRSPVSEKPDDDENQPQNQDPSHQGAKPDPWKELLSLAPAITLNEERKLRERLELKGITPAAFLDRVQQNNPQNWKRGPVAALFSIVKDWSQPAEEFYRTLEVITPKMEPKVTKTELELRDAIAAAPRRTQQENEILEAELRAKLATLPRPPLRSKTVQSKSVKPDAASAKLAAMGL